MEQGWFGERGLWFSLHHPHQLSWIFPSKGGSLSRGCSPTLRAWLSWQQGLRAWLLGRYFCVCEFHWLHLLQNRHHVRVAVRHLMCPPGPHWPALLAPLPFAWPIQPHLLNEGNIVLSGIQLPCSHSLESLTSSQYSSAFLLTHCLLRRCHTGVPWLWAPLSDCCLAH